MVKSIFMFIIMAASAVTFANETHPKWLSDWELVEKRDDGLTMECRMHKTGIPQCRVVTYSTIAPEVLLNVNTDPNSLPKWMANCLTSEQFERDSQHDYKMYMTWNFPGARNRDSVTHTTVTHSEDRRYWKLTFGSIVHDKKPKTLEFERYIAIRGAWEFEEVSTGKTKITYTNIALPGGYVQKYLSSIYNVSYKQANIDTVDKLIAYVTPRIAQYSRTAEVVDKG